MEGSRITKFLIEKRVPLLYLGIIVVLSLSVFRFNFGNLFNFPIGTNALDGYIGNFAIKKYGIITWYPLTDWGQPVIEVPTIIDPLIILLPETIYIRLFELVSFLLAGVTMYFVSKRFVKNEVSAMSSGLFYMIAVETSQFFEGHTSLMFSFAIFPLTILAVYDIIKRPSLKNAIILAFIFYILFSIGDIGAFYMIVIISFFEFIFLEAVNVVRKTFNFKHVRYIALSTALFAVVNSAWIFQYLSGNRPQFTTNVTTVIAPFSQVSGQPIYYSIVGFIADNSYTSITLHNYEYSFIHGYYYLIFLALPVLIFIYVAAKRDVKLVLLSVSVIPAIIISTANLYSGLSSFNEFLYFHFPLFNYIPALYRWNFYTDIVYALILAYIIDDAWNILHNKEIKWHWIRNLPLDKTLKNIFSKPKIRKIFAISVILIFVFVAFGQNSEIFTEPPGTFQFPHQYTVGYANLTQPADSNILTIPFGAIYSRTTYGGVSQSSEFMSPYFSNHNALMFQAGDPYSLQMDYFIGNGMTYGLTNNITKFLSAENTGYVVTTKYGNWSQSSDAIYNPPQNYEGYMKQYDKGSVIYSGMNQTTYGLSNSGQVYFSSTYYVYFGGPSLLYDILDEPWYNGTSTPLINGSLLQSTQAIQIIDHSAGLIVTPTSAHEITNYISSASSYRIPIIEIMDYSEMPKSSITKTYDPWNASNAYSFDLINGTIALPGASFSENLTSKGYDSVNVSARALAGNVFSLSFSADGDHLYRTMAASISKSAILPWANLSIVSAGINNQGLYTYNGTVKLETTENISSLLWSFTPNNNTFQYLNFEYGNILKADYLHFVQKGNSQYDYIFQAILSNGSKLYSSPVINSIDLYNRSDNLTNIYFNLAGLNEYASSLGNNVSVNRFVIGFPQTGNKSSVVLSDFDLMNASDNEETGFTNFNLGYLNLSRNPSLMILNATANVQFNTVTLIFTNGSTNINLQGYIKVISSNSSPSQYFLDLNTTSSGVLVFAQTYSDLWGLSGINGEHIVVNIGLNGWFINSTTKGTVNASITYAGQAYLYHGIVLEGILIATSIGLLVIWTDYKRKKINLI